MSDGLPIGIDFGTTKTLATRWDARSQRPVPIRLGRSRDLLPTTVYIDEKGNYLFGDDADDMEVRDSAGYLRRFKRDLGRDEKYRLRNGHSAGCVEVIAAYLRNVRERIGQEVLQGAPFGHTVITIPALYGLAARADLQKAAELAGFEDFSLSQEPVAGGDSYLFENASSLQMRNFVVFDWGGGTLDLAVIEKEGDMLRPNPDLIGGDPNLGGEDIDDAFAAMISGVLKQKGVAPLDEQPDQYRIAARRSLVEGKVLLSRQDSHKFYLTLAEGPVEIQCSREQFEEQIAGFVDIAVTRLAQIMARAEAASVKIDGILLIGGTSEIPLVGRRIFETSHIQPTRWDYGKEAVGLGAALEARKSDPSARSGKVFCTASSDTPMVVSCRVVWYYLDNGEQRGPIEEDAFDALVAAGSIRPETPVWHAGMATWLALSASDYRRPSAPLPANMPPLPTVAGGGALSCGSPDSTSNSLTPVPSSDKLTDGLAIIGGIAVVVLVIGGIALLFTGFGIPVGVGFFWIARLIYVAVAASSKR